MKQKEGEDSLYLKRKRQIFNTIQIGNKDDFISRLFDILIAAVIIINIAVMTLQTFDELSFAYGFMHKLEIITIVIFCVEYALRIWTADLLYPELSRPRAILKFLISFDGIVDLFTILPFFFLSGFVVFRMLRVVRIFHLFRINAQYDSFNVITTVLIEKKNQILSSVFILLILMLASSIGMYSAEHDAQPEAYKNAFSGIWWSVSALLTVGYGDIYPITVPGKILAICTAFLGVGVVAIPTGIISAGFVEQYSKVKHIHTVSAENALGFITIRIRRNHIWKDCMVRDMNLPQGLILALILRKDEVMVPRGDVMIRENDKLILGAETYVDELGIKLKEVTIDSDHPFVGQAIRDLDISRLTTIVTIRRKNKILIPDGSTVIRSHDRLIIYSKHPGAAAHPEIDL
jgi:voltage-gated potassium channel